jgi:uncharacterized membrane protein
MSSSPGAYEPESTSGLDRHFNLPTIRRVPANQPLEWLRLGWRDFRRNTALSAIYGLVFALAGYELLLLAQPRPYLFTVTISGFMLIAPMLAAGLYEISRRHDEGLTSRFRDSLQGWTRNGDSMAVFGLLFVLVAIAWERLAAILFALSYGGDLPSVQSFVSTVFLSGNYIGFVVAYIGVGGFLAAVVFAMSVISIPMLVDRRIDVITAIATSLKAVRQNPVAMTVWAALLVALVVLGFATLLLGMIVVLPWAAHASWHAYRDLTKP